MDAESGQGCAHCFTGAGADRTLVLMVAPIIKCIVPKCRVFRASSLGFKMGRSNGNDPTFVTMASWRCVDFPAARLVLLPDACDCYQRSEDKVRLSAFVVSGFLSFQSGTLVSPWTAWIVGRISKRLVFLA